MSPQKSSRPKFIEVDISNILSLQVGHLMVLTINVWLKPFILHIVSELKKVGFCVAEIHNSSIKYLNLFLKCWKASVFDLYEST